jgi:hypothetical protein
MRPVALGLLAVALCALPASALTQADLDAGARGATNGLRTVVRRLASDALRGRDNATPESTLAQTFLLRRLRRLGRGLDTSRRGLDAYRQPFDRAGQTGTNLLAVVRGRERPEEYVMVGAHYDHLDSRSRPDGTCSRTVEPGGAVCHGATDNATGVAAVLAIGRALRGLRTPPRRSVVLALWDAEEDGLVGSLHYVNAPLVPLAQTVGYVNFDILGADLLPSLARTTFAVGAETGGTVLPALVGAAVVAEGALVVQPVSFIFGQLRSDYANLVAHGVPTVFFSDSTGPCYHTTGDELARVDFAKLRAQSRIAFRVVAGLAEGTTPPAYAAPNPALAVYADATRVEQVLASAAADLALFAPDDQMLLAGIRADLDAIVADGPAAFDADRVTRLLADTLQSVAALQRLGCPAH